jgi:hypothetical protein
MTPEERALLLILAKWMLGIESLTEDTDTAEPENHRKFDELRELIARVETRKGETA